MVDSSRNKCSMDVLLRIIDLKNLPSKWLFNEENLVISGILELLHELKMFLKPVKRIEIEWTVHDLRI